MSARLRDVARGTEEIVAAGSYRASDGREVRLAAAIEAARAGTRMYGPGPVEVPPAASSLAVASLRDAAGTLSASSGAAVKSPTTRASPVLAPAAGRVVAGQA